MQKRFLISLILFLFGLFFLINSQVNITGAVIGISILTFTSSFIVGLFLFLISAVLFITRPSGLEKDIELKSAINRYKSLVRLAKAATNNEQAQEEIDHLIYELSRGNLEAGLGKPGHIKGTDIFYLRGDTGGRLYYHKIGESKKKVIFEIVGKSEKGRNQDQVIEKLEEYYT